MSDMAPIPGTRLHRLMELQREVDQIIASLPWWMRGFVRLAAWGYGLKPHRCTPSSYNLTINTRAPHEPINQDSEALEALSRRPK